MDKIGSFNLEKVALDKSGALAVVGTVGIGSRISRLLRPKFEIGLRRRDEQSIEWIPAKVTDGSGGRFRISATIDAASPSRAKGFSDVYFRRAGGPEDEAQRVHFPAGGGSWSAYPTKFGNLSFKKGAA